MLCSFPSTGLLPPWLGLFLGTLALCVFFKYFIPVCGLSSHSLDNVFYTREVFNFNKVQLCQLFLLQIVPLVLYLKKPLPYPQLSRFSPMLYSRGFTVLCLHVGL